MSRRDLKPIGYLITYNEDSSRNICPYVKGSGADREVDCPNSDWKLLGYYELDGLPVFTFEAD